MGKTGIFNISSVSAENKKGKKKMSLSAICREYASDPTNEDKRNRCFGALYKRMQWYAYKLVGDQDIAYDMVANTFEKAIKNHSQFDPEKGEYSTWIYRILRNVCFAYWHDTKKEGLVDNDISELHPTIFNNDDIQEKDVSDSIIQVEGKNALESVGIETCIQSLYNASINEIETMDPRFKKILVAKLIDKKTIKEIAEEEQCAESSVKHYLYKGKELISKTLQTKYRDLYEVYVSYI